jgi:hypothetical protein
MLPARILVTAVLIAALSAATGDAGEAARANLDILRDTIRANKKALVAVNLNLTGEEAAKFWPIYDRYQKDLTGVHDRLIALIEDYTANFRDLSNEKAMKLAEEYLSVEADRAKVRRAYLDEIAKALPGRKVARFYQIENKMDAVLRYDLAAEIPVVDVSERSDGTQ